MNKRTAQQAALDVIETDLDDATKALYSAQIQTQIVPTNAIQRTMYEQLLSIHLFLESFCQEWDVCQGLLLQDSTTSEEMDEMRPMLPHIVLFQKFWRTWRLRSSCQRIYPGKLDYPEEKWESGVELDPNVYSNVSQTLLANESVKDITDVFVKLHSQYGDNFVPMFMLKLIESLLNQVTNFDLLGEVQQATNGMQEE